MLEEKELGHVLEYSSNFSLFEEIFVGPIQIPPSSLLFGPTDVWLAFACAAVVTCAGGMGDAGGSATTPAQLPPLPARRGAGGLPGRVLPLGAHRQG